MTRAAPFKRASHSMCLSPAHWLCSIGLVLSLTPGQAAQWTYSHRVDTSLELSDNRRLALDDQRDTFGVITNLQFTVARNTERSTIELLPRLRRSEFWGDSRIADTTDKFLGLRAERRGERWTIASDLDLRQNTTRASEFDDDDIGINQVNAKRDRISFRPRFSYLLTERLSTSLNLGYTSVDYQSDGRTDLQPFENFSASASLSRSMTERTVLTGSIAAAFFRPEPNLSNVKAPTDTYSATIGVSHNVSPTFAVSGSFGVRRTTQRIDVRSVTVDKNISRGNTFGLSFNKAFERADISGTISRSISPSGTGSSRNRTSVSVEGEYRFSPFVKAVAGGRFRLDSRPESEDLKDSDQFYNWRAGLRWRLNRQWYTEAMFRYRAQETSTANYRARNSVLFSVGYRGDEVEW